jgi:hypothetical protein
MIKGTVKKKQAKRRRPGDQRPLSVKETAKKRKMMRVLLICVICILVPLFIFEPQLFPGIRYPLVDFEIEEVNPVDRDNWRVDYREAGVAYPEGFAVGFAPYGGEQFKRHSGEYAVSSKPYRKLYIRRISYEGGGSRGIFAENITQTFSGVCIKNTIYFFSGEVIEWSYDIPSRLKWWTQYDNGWYDAYFGYISDEVNFHRIFKRKRPGDKFVFKIVYEYRWDDGPMMTQELIYNVKAVKGAYRIPNTFLF